MCRLFAAAASDPVDVSFELLRSDNSVLRQSEAHDSGWGSVYYAEHGLPRASFGVLLVPADDRTWPSVRFPEHATARAS